ncbi:MAG: leucine-rich repeat domain-containing protein [Treponema sp.]|jgi:hypothetical protein|nr:leucine-rich repeat domain-containing protein [Treponema sp.]
MKNALKLLALMAIVAIVLTTLVVACTPQKTETQPQTATETQNAAGVTANFPIDGTTVESFNGTWVFNDELSNREFKLLNGNYIRTGSWRGTPISSKGTYSVSDGSFIETPTHQSGNNFGFDTALYTKTEIEAMLKNSKDTEDRDFRLLDEFFAPINYTAYSLNGNTLNLTLYTGEVITYTLSQKESGTATTPLSDFEIDGTTLVKYTGNATSVIIPNGITRIGNNAFQDNHLTSVIIPDGVTSIGSFAFKENKLTSIIIPNSVISIGTEAFSENKLTSITIPDSVTEIGDYIFLNNLLTSVTIPNSVISIGHYAFKQNQLTSVIIPDSVTSIGGEAFANNKLTSITIPKSVIEIGYQAFAGNQLNGNVIITDNSHIEIGDNAFGNEYIQYSGR